MPQSDEDQIRALENDFNAAWDRHDAEGMGRRLPTTPSSSPSTAPGLQVA